MHPFANSRLWLVAALCCLQSSKACPATTDSCRGLLFSGVSMHKTSKLFGGCREKCASSLLLPVSEIGGWKCGRCPVDPTYIIRDTAFVEMTLGPFDGIMEGEVLKAWDNVTKAHFVDFNTDIEIVEIGIYGLVQSTSTVPDATTRHNRRSLAQNQTKQVKTRYTLTVTYKPRKTDKVPAIAVMDDRVKKTYADKAGSVAYLPRLSKEPAFASLPSLTVVDAGKVKPAFSCPTNPPPTPPVKPPTPAPVKPPTKAPVKPPTPAPTRPPTKAPTPAPAKPPTRAPVPVQSPLPPGSSSPPSIATLPNIVINELMVNPIGTDGDLEWFELYNAGSSAVDLRNWKVTDTTTPTPNSFVINQTLTVPAGAYIVVTASANVTVNGGLVANYSYPYGSGGAGNFQLLNSADSILLYNANGRLVDEMQYNASYPGVATTAGVSMQLKSPTLDNGSLNSIDNWCSGTTVYGSTTNKGTPGAPNNCL